MPKSINLHVFSEATIVAAVFFENLIYKMSNKGHRIVCKQTMMTWCWYFGLVQIKFMFPLIPI